MRTPIEEKPKFVYTGEKASYSVNWYDTNIPNTKPREENGKLYFIIVLDDRRVEYWTKNPIDVIDYAKKKIWAKGKGRDAFGRAMILWYDEIGKKEHLCAIVDKDVRRYYEPVTRFQHNKKEWR